MASLGALRIPLPDFLGLRSPKNRTSPRSGKSSPAVPKRRNSQDEYCCRPPEMGADRFRLVIYKDSAKEDRKILFDSSTVRPRRASEAHELHFPLSPVGSQPRLDGKFELHKHRADTKMLGDMIFGAVSMRYKGESLKVHQLRSPRQVMLTKVFPGPPLPKTLNSQPVISETSALDYTSSDSDSQYSTIRSVDEYLNGPSSSRTIPMAVPERMYKTLPTKGRERKGSLVTNRTPSPDMLRSASASACLAKSASASSTRSSPSCEWTPAALSRVSRLRLNQASGWGSRGSHSSIESLTDEHCVTKRWQLGMAVLFNVDGDQDQSLDNLHQFVLTHVHLIELEVGRLQAEVERACLCRRRFFDIIHKAWTAFCSSIGLLREAPRLTAPVWLSLVEDRSNHLAARFVDVFARLVHTCDCKNTNFFLSQLLTAVLMHHLAWVSSVAPPLHNSLAGRQHGFAHNLEGATSFPYNPYLAQYLDVSGCVGFPVRHARTLVLGKSEEFVLELLFLLSYFIRCSAVKSQKRKTELCCSSEDEEETHTITKESQSPLRASPVRQNRDRRISARAELTALRGRANTLSVVNRCRAKARHDAVEKARKEQTANQSGRFRVQVVESCSSPDDRFRKSRSVPFNMCQDEQQPTPTDLCPAVRHRPRYQECSDGLMLELQEVEPITPTTHPNISSIDSGIGENEALNLMEQKCVKKRPPSTHQQIFARSAQDTIETSDLEAVRKQLLRLKCDSDGSSLGHSMLAGITPSYGRHFALSGLAPQHPPDICAQVNDDLRILANQCAPADQSNQSESVCVIANTNDWTVKVLSSNSHDYTLKDGQCTVPSSAVLSMVESTKSLRQMNVAPEFCLSFVEDCLSELYSKSNALSSFVSSQSEAVDTSHVSHVLGCDWSDVPLLLAVASVHSPHVLGTLKCS